MTTLDDIKDELDSRLDGAVSVLVGRRAADGGIDSAKLALASDAAEAFRGLARDCVDDLHEAAEVEYTVDAEIDGNEVFVVDDEEDLAELSELTGLADPAATLPTTEPENLDLRIQFYAVVLGDDSRITLVRRANPRIAYQRGRWLGVAGQQLTKLEEPAFSFSPGFDFVLGPGWAVILNQSAFERLFRDIGLIDKHVRGWVQGITEHLAMNVEAEVELLRVARRDSRTWRRLREIRRRGHLALVGMEEVQKYAKAVGLDPKSIVVDGELVFDPAERFSFLHLLNEDMYRGALTDETFEAQRKSPAGD